jgi:ketosteroid isomerase-like protein
MSNKNKEIIEKVNAAFTQGSTDGFLSYCAEDVVWTMVGDTTVKGKEAIRKWMGSMKIEPPKFTVNKVIADGDFGMAYGDMTMKDKDGKTAPYSYCDVYRFQNGKVIELTSFVIKTEANKERAAGSK